MCVAVQLMEKADLVGTVSTFPDRVSHVFKSILFNIILQYLTAVHMKNFLSRWQRIILKMYEYQTQDKNVIAV